VRTRLQPGEEFAMSHEGHHPRLRTPGTANTEGTMSDHEAPAKPALDADNSEPPRGDQGDKGLGTEAGLAQPGDQTILKTMPDHRGNPKYPDVENPDEQRPNRVPQEGHIEEDPKTVRDASPGAS